MLPLFQIITPNSDLPQHPVKPRRKKPEVAVHNLERKTFSANFNSKKQKASSPNRPKHTEVVIEVPERQSKRNLVKENSKLLKTNEELIVKFNELEELSVKKITKLKERINTVQEQNDQLVKDNEFIKGQFRELSGEYDRIKESFEQKEIALEKVKQKAENVEKEKKELEEDLNMLKNVVFRLNLQLERYQDKLRLKKQEGEEQALQILDESHQSHQHVPISWGKANVHTLGPLLDAYQDHLAEKEELILNYQNELTKFTGKLKQVVKENEILHFKLTEDLCSSSKLSIELSDVKKELKLAKEQNDALIKKCALKQDKNEEILKTYESQVEQLKRDCSVAQEQYYRARTELAGLREKYKANMETQEQFKNERQNYIPISVHTASVNECKKWYEELKSQYEAEKLKQTKLIEELQNKLENVTESKAQLELKIKELEKHLKRSQEKCLEVEQSLNQVQVAKTAVKKQLHKAMSFAKDMVAEQETLLKALNQRQMENKAVTKIGSEMATKMDFLRNQLKEVQKNAWEEFSTVEQRFKEQEEAIGNMKEEYETEILRLKGVIKELDAEVLLKGNLPKPPYLLYNEKYN